jgi:pimeloyl-ACP methyl ester carboxylesterase
MRARAVAGLAVVGAVLAVGCSVIDSVRGSSAPPSPTQLPVPSGAQALSRFYTQELSWSACDGGQCAELTVPLDYSAPDDASISIAVLRVPATSQRQRIGSLVVNPGGPGGSGVDYAAAADFIVGAPVRQRYDIVGFDPRGVARSEPIDCLSDAELDAWLGSDPSPDDAAEREAFVAASKAFAESCEKTAGPILRHVSTRDAAADMDILRAALGERTLTYLGKSYGTYLGAVYAGMFPDRVGRFVLDGAIAPELTRPPASNAPLVPGLRTASRGVPARWAGAWTRWLLVCSRCCGASMKGPPAPWSTTRA